LGDGGMDLSGLDMGPEAFDISSLLGGDQGIDFSQVAGDYGSDLGSELAAALQDTGNASSIFSDDGGIDVEALLNAQQGNNLTFDDDTEPGSSGGNQGSEGQAGFDDFGSYEGSSYSNLKFDDDTEPGSSGGTQGSEGAAGEGDLGSYEGSSYGGGGKKLTFDDDTEPGSSGGTQGSSGPAGDGSGGSKSIGGGGGGGGGGDKKLVFDDDTEPGSSGGTEGSTGVAGSGDLGSYKGSTYDTSGGTKTTVDKKTNVVTLPDGTQVTPGGVVTTCPSPEMLILLSSGEQRKAGDLQVGDEVKTQHETTMEWGNFNVTRAEIIPNAKRLNIKLDGKDFICSADHKFYKDGAWVDAKDIKVGDVLSDKVVSEITEHSTGDVVQITVDDAHTYICEGVLSHNKSPLPKTPTTPTKPGATTTPAGKKDNNMLMMMLALMAMMNKGGGSTGSGGTIPSLQANRSQLPYGPAAGAAPARPGAGGTTYFSPTSYTQRAAGGGMMYGGGGLSDLGGYSDGGRLLKGPGDGVSDSIPATIGGKQPARLATGEFVVPARIVSELGNGSTDAGAQKLYAMMDRVQKARRKTKNVAADTKAHKYLPS